MERHIRIHDHSNQPLRDRPWPGSIEAQDSAYPCHDWNERVTAERNAPNRAVRILDSEGRIERFVIDYSI
jgi:hypothetical protein